MSNQITIKDIAKMCGCGVSTVSRALNNHPDINEETRNKIMSVVSEYNFIPNNSARNIRISDSKTIAILIKGISNPFFMKMIRVMEKEIQKRKYSLIIQHVEYNQDEVDAAIELEKEKRLKGIIFLGGYFNHTKEKLDAIKVTAIILAGAICAAAFTGCGINTGATAASMKNQTVTMGMANFACRYQQANVEDYYKSMLGAKSSSELWSKDLYANGTTMEDTMKDSVMEQLHEMYTLQAHMKGYDVRVTKDEKAAIKKAAQQFISDNSSEALKEMTADEDTVEELLTLYTIRSKMQKAIEAEADTNVTDEEANERGYTMMTISTTSHQDDSGNTVEYTDDEKSC